MMEPAFKIKEEKVTEDYGEFIIEPLEPGYGHTLGNALRRVLLVSIPGASVTSVKISGAKHKFSTIPGLKENLVDFLLNIKGLNLRLLDSKALSTVKLSVKGQKEITAKDDRDQDLSQRTAQNSHKLAKEHENPVTGFMDDKINIIYKMPGFRISRAIQKIVTKNNSACQFPIVYFI